jgi:hypothetical protein
MYLFPGSRPKKGLSSNGFTKTVTVRLRSIVPKRPTAHGLLRYDDDEEEAEEKGFLKANTVRRSRR